MRAFSSKKFVEPIVLDNSVLLSSRDGELEVRVNVPIKYIDARTNKTTVVKPRVAHVSQSVR